MKKTTNPNLKEIHLLKNNKGYAFDCPHCKAIDTFYPTSSLEEKALTIGGALHTCYKCKGSFKLFVSARKKVRR